MKEYISVRMQLESDEKTITTFKKIMEWDRWNHGILRSLKL